MSDTFDKTKTFEDLELRGSVLKGVTEAGFEHPTDIQAKLIPVILAGKDVIGQAKTGTGKTAAFALPILHLAEKDVPRQALVLTPTRELAAQVAGEINELGHFTPIKTACIIGGESMRQQSRALEQGAQIVVGTPGRVMDMYGRRQLPFDNVRFVVLDEVDRMLDIGFRDDIRKILKQIQREHQTIFVSATIDEEIERLARTFMKDDAEKILTVSGSLTVEMVDQKYLPVAPWDKRRLLKHLLKHEEPDTTLVFCRTKATVRRVREYLQKEGINCREIHGDMHQTKRNKVMESMRSGKLDVLIASDLAARGLDVEHISHVINYDLPEDPEVYVHRIGRTARAGRRGIAWAFVEPEQGQMLTEIEKLTGVLIEQLEYPDFQPGPVPEGAQVRKREGPREPAKAGDIVSRRSLSPELAELDEEELKRRFPDGVVPKTPPRRNLGGRFRTRRR